MLSTPTLRRFLTRLILSSLGWVLLLAVFLPLNAGGSSSVSVWVAPSSATLLTGTTQQFTDTVQGTSRTAVTWSCTGGTITSTGLFTAPATPGTYTVKATLVSNTSIYGTSQAYVVVPQIASISVTGPGGKTSATLGTSQTLNLTGSVNGYGDLSGTWSFSGGAGLVTGGITYFSTSTSTLAYTAPPAPGTYTVTYTSHQDPSKSGIMALTVVPVGVTIAPPSVSVAPNSTQAFIATVSGLSNSSVTWSCSGGTVDGTGRYTAPASAGTYTVTATSVQDPTKSATATVIVTLTVTLDPLYTQVYPNSAYTFSATVNGASNPAVTWSCTGGVFGASTTSTNVTRVYWVAPSMAGHYTVTATSVADPTRSVTLDVPVALKVQVTAPVSAIQVGTTYQGQVQVSGSSDARVTWSIDTNRSDAGGMITPDGLFTAPSSTPVGNRLGYYIQATSVADPTQSDERYLSVFQPASITLSPSAGIVPLGGTLALNAIVTGSDVPSDYIVWEKTGGSIQLLNASTNFKGPTKATYTAPRTPGIYTVTVAPILSGSFNAAAVPGVSATATLTVVQAAAKATLVPGPVVIETGGTQQYLVSITGVVDPTVVWTCTAGTITSNGLYTAPSTAGTYTITATSKVDPTGAASTTVTVRAATAKPKITVSPQMATVQPGGTQQLSATLVNAGTATVSWFTEAPSYGQGSFTSSGSTGTYTAPTTYPFMNGPSASIDAYATAGQGYLRADLFDRSVITVQPAGTINVALDLSNRYEFVQGEKFQFKANVTGTADTRVLWSDPQAMLLSPMGDMDTTSGWIFTAPYTDFLICASSVADPTRKAMGSVRVWNKGAVRIFAPSISNLLPSQQVQLDVEVKGGGGVVWSATAGTITPAGLYTAPASVTNDTWVSVQATNAVDGTSYDTIGFDVRVAGSVDVSPTGVTVLTGGKQTFAAKVWNSSASVTWSARMTNGSALSPGAIGKTGVYTAPTSLNTGEGSRSVTIRATNATDTTKWAEASVSVYPTAASQPPPAGGTLYLNGVTSLWTGTIRTAYYDGGGDTVTWSMTGGTILSTGRQEFGFPPMWYAVYQVGSAGLTASLTAKATNASGSVSVSSTPITVTAIPDFAGIFTLSAGSTYSILDFGMVTETRTDGTVMTYRKVWSNGISGALQGNDLSIADSFQGSFSNDAQVYNLSGGSAPVPANRTPGIVIGVDPANGAYVKIGSTLQLHSGMGGTTNKAVTWTCSGGTISSAGLYTPPATPGTYTVTATSQVDPTKSYTVKVGVDSGATISNITGVYTGTTTYAGADAHTYPLSVFTDSGTTYVKLYGVNTWGGSPLAVAKGTLNGRTFQGTFAEYNPSWYATDQESVNLVFERQPDGSMGLSGGYFTVHGFPSSGGGTSYGGTPVWAAFTGTLAPNQVDVAVAPHLQDGYYGISYSYGSPEPHVMSGTAMSFKGMVCGSLNGAVTWTARSGSTGAVAPSAFSTATGNSTVFTVPRETGTGISYSVTATSSADTSKADLATFPVDTTSGLITPTTSTLYLLQGLDTGAINGYFPTTADLSLSFAQVPSSDATWSVLETGDSGTIKLNNPLYTESTATYTPGSTPGIYTVVATSKWDATRTALAKMTVLEGTPTVLYPFLDKSRISAGDRVTLSWLGAWAFNTPNPTVTLTILDQVTQTSQVVDVSSVDSYSCTPIHSLQFTFTVTSASGKKGTKPFNVSVDPTQGASLYLAPNPVGFQAPFTASVFFSQGTARLSLQTGSYSWLDLGAVANGAAIQIDPSKVPWTGWDHVSLMATLTDASGNTGTTPATAPIKPKILSFTSSVPGLLTGALQPVTLSWSINSASRAATLSLVATNSKGSFFVTLPSGGATSTAVNPTETTSYTLTVTTYYNGTYGSTAMTDQQSLNVIVGPVTSLQVTPATAKITPGQTVSMAASIVALPGSEGVTWSASGGAVAGSGLNATYTAPTGQGTYTITVRSVVDPTISATVTITVWYPPATLSITPAATSLNVGSTTIFGYQISLTGSTNNAITWSVQEGIAGGTITQSGGYTAPLTAGVYHVIVTSQANPTVSAAATVTVVLPEVQVSVFPAAVSLVQGATYQFGFSSSMGSLNWSASGGTVTPAGLYTAPTTTGIYTVTATSALNPADTASATVTVALSSTASIHVAPEAINLFPGVQQTFKATVLGMSNTAVNWTVLGSGGGTISSSGVYVAPAGFGSYIIQATSSQDASVVGTAKVNVANLVVMPATTTLVPGGTQAFSASIALGASGPVSWAVSEGTLGGSVDSNGYYTAPMVNGVFHLVASLPDGSSVTVPIQVGLADDLVVGFPMLVMQSGTYRITAQLKGSKGHTLSQSVELPLTVGNATPELKYLASDIRRYLGVDGSWEVVDVEVEYQDLSTGEYVPSDAAPDLGSTNPFLLRQLRQPWASLTGDFQATGVTTSPSGTPLTGLQAKIGVNLLGAGTYQVGAVLVDANSNRVATVTLQTVTLPTGISTITVVFPGSQIAQSQAAGPYSVSELTIIGPTSLVLNRVGTISGYTWSQFQ